MASFGEISELMMNSILEARKILPQTQISDALVGRILQFCVDNCIDGHRAEIVIVKTARSYAALELKHQVELKHVKMAMILSLLHRTRDGGLKKALTRAEIESWFEGIKEEGKDSLAFSMDYNPENVSLLKGGFVSPSKKSGTASQS